VSAVDALITIERSSVRRGLERRVAREIAGLVGGWVLFRRRGRRWLSLRPQAEHTLSTWSILRLSRVRTLRALRVRPRPEFWRPEQRRPGGVLLFPLGKGVVCIGRRRPFDEREVAAVGTVLRFLEAKLADRARGPTSTTALRTVVRKPTILPSSAGLVGETPVWRRVLDEVGRVADSSCSVLLVGESGTGKEGIARALHFASRRSRHAFVPVNCGAVTATLLPSELFGHARGAFTGAERGRTGLFAQAHRGTLFLDEIADMPPEMQVALLRVIEERQVRPVGSATPVPADARIVTASARDLVDEVAPGRFREDLFHRVNVIRTEVPPLRERKDDIPLLAAHLMARLPEEVRIHPDVFPLLARYDWPGNVRELDNVLRASAALADGEEVTPEVVAGILAQPRPGRNRPAPAPAVDPALPVRERDILGALSSAWLSSTELAIRLGVTPRTVERDLTNLRARGLVVASGDARARRYGKSRETPAPAP
jgi:DNA-binding NtrC family response regulator